MRQGIPLGALVSVAAPPSSSSSRTRKQLRGRRWSSDNNRKTRHALPEPSFANRWAVRLILSLSLSLFLSWPTEAASVYFRSRFPRRERHGPRESRHSSRDLYSQSRKLARVHPSSFMSSYRRLNEMQTTRVWVNCLSLPRRWEI